MTGQNGLKIEGALDTDWYSDLPGYGVLKMMTSLLAHLLRT